MAKPCFFIVFMLLQVLKPALVSVGSCQHESTFTGSVRLLMNGPEAARHPIAGFCSMSTGTKQENMTQREVTDENNTTWTCVQAYAGLDKEASEKAAALSEHDDGTVPVVCTPGGGEQSVRLALPKNWMDALSDEELLSEITAAQEEE